MRTLCESSANRFLAKSSSKEKKATKGKCYVFSLSDLDASVTRRLTMRYISVVPRIRQAANSPPPVKSCNYADAVGRPRGANCLPFQATVPTFSRAPQLVQRLMESARFAPGWRDPLQTPLGLTVSLFVKGAAWSRALRGISGELERRAGAEHLTSSLDSLCH